VQAPNRRQSKCPNPGCGLNICRPVTSCQLAQTGFQLVLPAVWSEVVLTTLGSKTPIFSWEPNLSFSVGGPKIRAVTERTCGRWPTRWGNDWAMLRAGQPLGNGLGNLDRKRTRNHPKTDQKSPLGRTKPWSQYTQKHVLAKEKFLKFHTVA
jgi:hypothetical protein